MLISFQKMLKKKKRKEKLWTFIQSTDVTKDTDFRRVVVTVKSQKPAKRQVCSHEHRWPVASTEFSSLVLGSFFTLKKSLVLNTPVHSNVRLIFSWPASCTIQVFTSVLDCFSHQHLVTNSLTYNEQDIRIQFSHLS